MDNEKLHYHSIETKHLSSLAREACSLKLDHVNLLFATLIFKSSSELRTLLNFLDADELLLALILSNANLVTLKSPTAIHGLEIKI